MSNGMRIQHVAREHLSYVRLFGSVDETFRPDALAEQITGRDVILNMKSIARFSSFGVREWVRFVERLRAKAGRIYLVECSPAVVGQLNLVSNFAVGLSVVSVQVPFYCEKCTWDTTAVVQVPQQSTDPQIVLPQQLCKRCGGQMLFDDDVDSYFSFARDPEYVAMGTEITEFMRKFADAFEDTAAGATLSGSGRILLPDSGPESAADDPFAGFELDAAPALAVAAPPAPLAEAPVDEAPRASDADALPRFDLADESQTIAEGATVMEAAPRAPEAQAFPPVAETRPIAIVPLPVTPEPSRPEFALPPRRRGRPAAVAGLVALVLALTGWWALRDGAPESEEQSSPSAVEPEGTGAALAPAPAEQTPAPAPQEATQAQAEAKRAPAAPPPTPEQLKAIEAKQRELLALMRKKACPAVVRQGDALVGAGVALRDDALTAFATCLMRTGDLDRAAKHIEELVARGAPPHLAANLMFQRAMLLAQRKQLAVAADVMREIIRRYPGTPQRRGAEKKLRQWKQRP